MNVVRLAGVELEKEKPNTSEDFFNRSTVIYSENGVEKTFELLYVRYFEEQLEQQGNSDKDAIMQLEDRSYSIKEIAALAALLSDENCKKKRKVYINEFPVFSSLFHAENVNRIKNCLTSTKM